MARKSLVSDGQGKTDLQRPRFISDEEWDLRYTLAVGIITKEEFERSYDALHDKRIKEIKNEKSRCL